MEGAEPASNLFDKVPTSSQLGVEFQLSAFVTVHAPTDESFLPQLRPGRPPKLRQILHEVNGRVSPGEVVALMGPSGSGKSTLLEIIGGRSSRSVRVKGAILFDGAKMNKAVKRRMAFVSQDDLLHQSLTVEESLTYIALLRLPKSWPKAKKLGRVERVIDVLRLDRARNTVIGNGTTQRGVSGGERKRTSVGCELLTNPSLMLLDEPTSGLDSTIALQLVQSLRDLAHDGRAIITSIHQPSSRLLYQFDSILLLSEGRSMYYGSAAGCSSYFDALGFRVPLGISTSEFILDLASSECADPSDQGRSGEQVRADLVSINERYLRCTESADGFDVGDLETLSRAAAAAAAAVASPEETTIGEPKATASGRTGGRMSFRRHDSIVVPSGGGDDRIGWLSQVAILTHRSIKTRRHDVVTLQDFLQFAVVGVFAGCFWFDVGGGDGGVNVVAANEISGLLFFVMMYVADATCVPR